MNRIKQLFSIALLTLVCIACENGNINDLPPNPTEGTTYSGRMVVDQNDGSYYTQDDVEVDYEIKDGKLNFVMYKVKFASGMPIKLDMVVEGVDYEESTEGCYTLSADGLVPYAMGGPFEKYTITNLTGEISDSDMTLDFMCGEHPVTYNGTK